jgi:D-alanyl-D-alanine carboxypeptidase (penicillin-binding protein 5/6)
VDDENYSSAADYALLTKYAMQNETFRKIVKSKTKTLSIDGKKNPLKSTNEMLGSYLGTNGVKTGFTDEAGYCFIASAKRDDVELYAVIFDSSSEEQRFDDAEEVLDWGFEHYRSVTLTGADELVASVSLTDWIDKRADVYVQEPPKALLFDYDGDITTDVKLEEHSGAVEIGQSVGSVDYLLDETVVATANLVSATEMRAPDFFETIGIFFSRIGAFFTGAPSSAETEIFMPSVITVQ